MKFLEFEDTRLGQTVLLVFNQEQKIETMEIELRQSKALEEFFNLPIIGYQEIARKFVELPALSNEELKEVFSIYSERLSSKITLYITNLGRVKYISMCFKSAPRDLADFFNINALTVN